MKYHVPQAQVISQQQIGPRIFILTLACPEIAAEAKPGQFAHLRCGRGSDPLLRRPLSIFQTEPRKGLVSFCYQVVGQGTQLLSKLLAGAAVDVMGPLGNGFATDISGQKIGLVGGGMGVAPLIFLGQVLEKQNQVQAFWGARNKGMLPPLGGSLTAARFSYAVATEDGSAGQRGLVTALLEQWLAQETPARLYACGPRPMLTAVARLADAQGIPLQVSLEAVMACGVGACLGCTCEKAGNKRKNAVEGIKAGGAPGVGDASKAGYFSDVAGSPETAGSLRQDTEKRVKVCQDGPVFWAEEVKWDGA